MTNMKKRIPALILSLVAVLVLLLPGLAGARGQIDTETHVTLSLTYEDNERGLKLSNVPFEIYEVASVDKYGQFTLLPPFSGYSISLDGLDKQGWLDLALTLQTKVITNKVTPEDTATTNAQGVASFPSTGYLNPGLYLILGKTQTFGDYTYTPTPFMLQLPNLDEATDEWLYDVSSNVKFTRTYIPPQPQTTTRKVLKVWSDAGFEASRPAKVVVQLLCDGRVMDTQTLSANNRWMFTWDNLPLGHNYLVAEQEVPGYTISIHQEGITFVVTNSRPTVPTPTPPGPIAKTGMLWWPVPVLVLVGLALVLIGLLRRRGNRNAR